MEGRGRNRSWRPRRGGRCDVSILRGAPGRDHPGAGTSVLARRTAAGCRGSTSMRARRDPPLPVSPWGGGAGGQWVLRMVLLHVVEFLVELEIMMQRYKK